MQSGNSRVRYRGRNIAEILEMSVSEAKDLFVKHPAILANGNTGCGRSGIIWKLGQPANLSGGESQRLKLSLELVEDNLEKCYIY